MKYLFLLIVLLFIAYAFKKKGNVRRKKLKRSSRFLRGAQPPLLTEDAEEQEAAEAPLEAKPQSAKPFKATRKSPLSSREQEMYKVLKEAFPEPDFSVLSQVSMQALITTPRGDQGMRNRYDRKYADFVICSPSFFVIAVIELDDWTHNGKEEKDAERDAMLASAGIKTRRYREMPTPEQVRKDVMPTNT